MPMKQKGKKVYRTALGKAIDMDMLRKKNELTPAVGNVRVNARGDELGPGGQIVRKHEDLVREYYKENPVNVVDEEPTRTAQTVVEEETPTMKKTTSSKEVSRAQQAAAEEEWVEDDDGNFVPKGE